MKLYFGFGANRDLQMIRAITGRYAVGIPAWIQDFKLGVESMRDIPARAQRILWTHWNKDFVSYGLTPKRSGLVRGRLWLVTNRQREYIREWELVGLWSKETFVNARLSLFGFHISVPAVSEILLQQKVRPVDGSDYRTFIVPKDKILHVANVVRQKTLSCAG